MYYIWLDLTLFSVDKDVSGYFLDRLSFFFDADEFLYHVYTNCIAFELQYFDGYGYHGTSFEQTYRCYPASFIDKV